MLQPVPFRIKKIGVNISGKNSFFLAPIYKFSKRDFVLLINEVGIFIEKGKIDCYMEDAFNTISNRIILKPVYYSDEFCMEIDTLNDLKLAKSYYVNKHN